MQALVPTFRIVYNFEGAPTVADYLRIFSVQEFNNVRNDFLVVKASFVVNPTPSSHREFRHELFRYYAHIHHELYGATIDPYGQPLRTFEWLRSMYKKDFQAAERNAVLRRDNGGIIGIIDEITENAINAHIATFVDLTFFEYMPVTEDARLKLATDFIKNHAARVFPDSRDLRQPYMIAQNIEEVIVEYAKALNPIYKSLRW